MEEIIDGTVKTGADLSRVVAWNYENSRLILEARTPVPALLHGRLSVNYTDRESRPPSPIASRDHWRPPCAPIRAIEARRVVEDYLAHFPPGRREAVLRGALVSAYLRERPVSDGAVWLAGVKGEGGQREAGVGHLTAGALREIGLLDEVMETEKGLLVYPNAAPQRPHRGVWP